MELWSPKSKSDTGGRFTISLPRISRIGKDAIAEVALSLSEPAGGWTTMTVADIEFADLKETTERCFVATAGRQLSLLSNEKGPLKVKIEEKAGEVDLGRIIVN